MINSDRFASDEEYRLEQFQTIPLDRPLVAHFSANNPELFLRAAKLVESECDAIDLNLGCPQRIAHAGHFGSYLLDEIDRDLVLSLVRTVSSNIQIPMFVKIRLLDTVPDTIRLCEQLISAGAALIAIHGRYRVNLVGRSGPGARDGPAHLDQIKEIKRALMHTNVPIIANGNVCSWQDCVDNLTFTETDGIMSAEGILDDPAIFFPSLGKKNATQRSSSALICEKPQPVALALEYLDLVHQYPVPIKSIIFHIRRMLKKEFDKYQLLDECLVALNVEQVRCVVEKVVDFQEKGTFVESAEKARRAKELIDRKKREEGKRKAFEDRMVRKAKREGKPLDFYLRVGLDAPSSDDVQQLKLLEQKERFEIWKKRFGQHCYAYHFSNESCPRERTCAFLHVDIAYSEEPAFG